MKVHQLNTTLTADICDRTLKTKYRLNKGKQEHFTYYLWNDQQEYKLCLLRKKLTLLVNNSYNSSICTLHFQVKEI